MSLLFLRMVSYIFIYNLNTANLTGSELMSYDCLEERAPPKITQAWMCWWSMIICSKFYIYQMKWANMADLEFYHLNYLRKQLF